MGNRTEIIAEAAKATPPAVVVASNKLLGMDLPTVVALATLLYLLIQIFYLLWKWRHEAWDRANDRRHENVPVTHDRRRNRGSINRSLVSGMSIASLVAAIGAGVVLYEGDGPTSIDPVTGAMLHHAYPDPAHGWNVPTICQGRTRGVYPGMAVTADQCWIWLQEELDREVVASLRRNVKMPVTFHQAVALGKFRDNVGETQFRASKLLREVNAGRCRSAAREFNAAPQIVNGRPRIWTGRSIIDRQTGAVLLATGGHVMKWTTGGGIPLAGLIKRRADERSQFEAHCHIWEGEGQ